MKDRTLHKGKNEGGKLLNKQNTTYSKQTLKMETIITLQHNVQHLSTRNHNLQNTYIQINPDIILLNSHGVRQKSN